MTELVLRSTSLSTFQTCPKKYYYQYERGLEKKAYENPHLTFGKRLHSALEEFYKTLDMAKSLKALGNPNDFPTHKIKNYNVAQSLLRHYFKHWLRDSFVVLEVEAEFEMEINEFVKWKGKFDGLVEKEGLVYVLEHKTSQNLNFQTKPNLQLIAYYWAGKLFCQERYPDKVFGGIIVNVLDAKNIDFTRVYVTFGDTEIEEFLQETELNASFISECKSLGIFPKNSKSCGLYFSECPYLMLCRIENANFREKVIAGEYEINEEVKNLDW